MFKVLRSNRRLNRLGESREVLIAILSEGKRVITARKAGLEIVQDHVDPLELWQVLGLSPGDDGRPMNVAGVDDGFETSQTIRRHRRSRTEVAFGPLGNCRQGKTGNEREFGTQGVALLTERDGCHEGNLVLRTAPGFAAGTLASQGVIDLHLTFEHIALFSLFHRPHQLVLDESGGRFTLSLSRGSATETFNSSNEPSRRGAVDQQHQLPVSGGGAGALGGQPGKAMADQSWRLTRPA